LSPEAENAPMGGKPVVCYVTDRRGLAVENLNATLILSIRAAIAAGVDWVQIREKDLSSRELLDLARAAVCAAEERRGNSPAVIVNDRLDVALAAGAAGVHVGRESIPTEEVVRWCRGGNAPKGFVVGVSCHSLADAREAESAGANYVIFGPVFDTPSKRPFGPPQGTSKLMDVCSAIRIPVIAIGGINQQNAVECLRAGAAGIAAIRMFQEQNSANPLRKRIAQLHGWRAAS
jgi:thiamine-phosphate pyrophosphorylase